MEIDKQMLSRQLEKNQKRAKSGSKIRGEIWFSLLEAKWGYAELFPARKYMKINKQMLSRELEKD